MTTTYNKPFKTVVEQLALLQERGLEISDLDKASASLHRIGYYRLSEYWYPMRLSEIQNGNGLKIIQDFQKESKFIDAIELYVFDKRLRLLLLDAMERIEISMRVWCAHNLGEIDPYFHRDWRNFNKTFVGKQHANWLSKIDSYAGRSKHDLVHNFLNEFDHPLPIWVSIECWDFGALSYFVSGMNDLVLNEMSKYYNIPRRELLVSWLRALSHVRNICAHHSRLWNKVLVDRPKPTRVGEVHVLDHMAVSTNSHNRIYSVAAIIQFLMKTIHPESTWSSRLKLHFETFPKSSLLHLKTSGFPKGWQEQELWN